MYECIVCSYGKVVCSFEFLTKKFDRETSVSTKYGSLSWRRVHLYPQFNFIFMQVR